MSSRVDVSVVIPFRSAAPYIQTQLEALERQDFAGDWEIIAVDNGSRDASRQIAESFLARLNLRLVDAPASRGGAAYATNVGVLHARGAKLIFIDADDEIEPGYISAMAAALDVHDFVTSAFDHRALNADWVQSAHGPAWRQPDEPLFVQFGVLPFAGGSIGVSRPVYEKVGGFPEQLPRMYDIAFSWEVQFAGTSLHYVPEAVYRVRYRNSLCGLLRQGFAGGSTAPLLYTRYRAAGMERRHLAEVAKSWARLALRFARARSRAELAPLMIALGRELGRPSGSIRHRVFFP